MGAQPAESSCSRACVTQGYNAFLIFPGDPVGSNATAGELAETGAPVIALAGCLKEPTKAAFCFGTDTGNSAYLGTKELIKAMGGKRPHRPFHRLPRRPQHAAAHRCGGEGGQGSKAPEVVQVIADIDAPEPAEEKINAYLAAHAGDVDGIVTTAWVPAVVAANALRKIGDKRIKMVGIDHDEVVLKAIKDGFVNGTMLQNPYGQGYIGSFAADKLRTGCTVKADAPFKSNALTDQFIDSGTVFVDADAGRQLCRLMQAITKTI